MRRVISHHFWVRHRSLAGFAILAVTTLVALHVALDAASKGEQAHSALCANRADLEQREAQSRAYLRMTPEERAKKFGLALAHIPRATILTQILNYERTIRSYDPLRC